MSYKKNKNLFIFLLNLYLNKNLIKMKKCKYCKAREVSKTRKNCKFCSIECTQKYFKKYKISAFYNPKLHSYIARLGGKSTQRLYPNLSSNNGKRAQITLKRLGKGMYNKKNPLGKLGGKIGGKKGAETNKKNKTGCCYHPKWRGVGGKIGGVVSHIRHPNLARENGKRTLKILRKLKIGACHDPKWKGAGGRVGGKAVQKLLKEKQISAFYNPKIQREIRLNIYNNRHSFYFNKIYYDSNMEREIAMNIHYQLER